MDFLCGISPNRGVTPRERRTSRCRYDHAAAQAVAACLMGSRARLGCGEVKAMIGEAHECRLMQEILLSLDPRMLDHGICCLPSLADCKAHRAWLASDPPGRENYKFANREGFSRRKDWLFVRLTSNQQGVRV